LEQLERNEAGRRQRAYQLILQQDEMAVKKCDLALKHKAQVEALRVAHSALLEARIRLIEAASDVDALKARNEGIAQQLEDERQALNRATREAVETKQAAKECLRVCQAILAQYEEHNDYFQSLDSELTLEQLTNDIDAEKSKLDYIHEGNPGALKEFQDREVSIDKMIDKIRDSDRKLESFNRRITEVKEKWEPELDKLIAEISTAFAYNFEQISCAGEVGVHKDEDFDLWSIEIRVKFR
jgi:chromosome segregation ATPase